MSRNENESLLVSGGSIQYGANDVVVTQQTYFIFKTLDGRDTYDGLPTDQSLYQRVDFSDVFQAPAFVISNPRLGGKVLQPGQYMFVEHQYKGKINYHLVTDP